jgi:heme/copper-type cytochrome/quinol oxidase subunit 2
MLRVQCAELCGVGHADMQATVEIMTRKGFMHWVAQQKAQAKRTAKLSQQEAKKLQRQQQKELKKAGYG